SVHPGTVEVCNGRDDDCNGSIDDAVPLPTARPNLTEGRSGSSSLLSWTGAADATSYDVIRGSLDTRRASTGGFATSTSGCVANDVTVTSVQESRVLLPGAGLWHLVRA